MQHSKSMKKIAHFRTLIWLWLVVLVASCQSLASSPPPTAQKPVDIPTPSKWEPPPDIPTTLGLSVQDFRSNFEHYSIIPNPGMPKSVNRGPSLTLEVYGLAPPASLLEQKPDAYSEHVRELVQLLREGLSLQRVNDDEVSPVEVEVREGWYDPQGRGPDPEFGFRPGFSLVPKSPLSEGWYVLQADLSRALQLGIHRPHLIGPRDGDVLHARIYIGSRPMWYRLYIQCRAFADAPQLPVTTDGRSCVFDFGLTETIGPEAFQQGSASIRVRYDNEEVACAVLDEADPLGEPSVRVVCPEPQEGTQIEAVLESPQIPDPLSHVATPVKFVFNRETFHNIAGEDDPIFEGIISPFDNFGLE